ncbi:MAG: alcohol dehydrogenase, partial [Clostridiales bacterium]|nr:alcohol dehydrogenase [Clostridiales bacterium]
MEFKYEMPTKIFFGEEVVLKNKEVFATIGSKALIVTGRRSAKINGSYHDVSKALSSTG